MELKKATSILSRPDLSWALVILWMIVIFAFSHQPYSGAVTEQYLGDMNIPIRKLAHITEYALMLVLFRRALENTWRTRGLTLKHAGWLSFVLTFIYALSDEWHQSMVPGRSATISDVAVDMSGAAIGWLVYALLIRVSISRARQP